MPDELPSGSERRRFYRYLVNFPCSVRKARRRRAPKALSEPEIQTATTDVSAGGLYFEANADWRVGTGIECLLRLPVKAFGGRPVGIRCRGKIARIVPREGAAVGVGATIEQFEFLHLEKQGR